MFRVTREAIDLQGLVDFVTDPEAGAIVTFIGTTRNNNEGRKVIALDYEAYPEMAEKELKRLGERFSREWVRSVGSEANQLFIPYYTQR